MSAPNPPSSPAPAQATADTTDTSYTYVRDTSVGGVFESSDEAFAFEEEVDLGPPPPPRTFDDHRVIAVLVAHNGTRWLPAALAAIGAQTRPANVVVAVDTGSTDRSSELLADDLGPDNVLTLDRHTTFGAAVAAGVEHASNVVGGHPPERTWIWTLHDDSAPLPQALENLLATVDIAPSIGIVGPKVRGWMDTRHLLEVGLTIAGSGRRETGLERNEQDQGQHDGTRDVLAVGSAGMLVRRDVWDELGGFDPRIRLFRDDIDLGWRANLAGHRVVVSSEAIVHHAEAASHRRRGKDAARHGLHRADREAALHVLLANRPPIQLPWTYLRLTLATLLRAIALLLGKAPGDAAEEIGAYAAVVLRPDRIWRARRARRTARTVAPRKLRKLMAPWGSQARHGLETVTQVFVGNADRVRFVRIPRGRQVLEEDEDLIYLPPETANERPWWRRLLARPGALLAIGLLVVTLVAVWPLIGRGFLQGGALLPADLGSSDLFSAYRDSWHAVGLGSTAAAPPSFWMLGVASLPFLGSVSLLVDILLLLSVPLAGLSAYLALRQVHLEMLIKVWVAAAYALLPAATGAIATGRLGTVVVHLLLPPLVVAALRVPGSTRAAAATGLLLSAVVSFAPVLWPVTVVLAAVAIPFLWPSWREIARVLGAVVSPLVLLVPWSFQLLGEPSRLLLEMGVPAAELAEALPAWQLPLFTPGGPGTPWALLVLGVLAAAFAALLRPDRRRLVEATWAVAFATLLIAAVLSRLTTTPVTTGIPQGVWTGPVMVLLGGALVFGAAVAADRIGIVLGGRSFGWRQPLALVVAVAAAVVPLLLAGSWMLRDASSPLVRDDGGVLPGRVAALLADDRQQRALVLSSSSTGEVTWSLDRTNGPVLGDADVAAPASQVDHVDALVSALISGRAVGDEQQRLADLAVAYVVAAEDLSRDVVDALDNVPGVARVTTNSSDEPTWEVVARTGRVRVLREDGGVRVLQSASTSLTAEITQGPAGRRLVLAETYDDGWQATLDGEPLEPSRYEGWAQSFDLPISSGTVSVWREGDSRGWWLAGQALVVVAAVVLALPGRRLDEEES